MKMRSAVIILSSHVNKSFTLTLQPESRSSGSKGQTSVTSVFKEKGKWKEDNTMYKFE